MVEEPRRDWEDPELVEFFVRKQSCPLGRAIDEEFLAFLQLRGSWRCLDVGCGPGVLTGEVAGRALFATGADLSAAMIARAEALAQERGISNARFVRTPAEVLPFEEDEFDLAFATSVIFLLPEPLLGLREMVRVVRPGGWVGTYQPSTEMSVLANQAYAARQGITGFEAEMLTRWGGAAERYQRFSVGETEAIYQHAGLVDIETQTALDGLVLFARGRKPLPEEVTEPLAEAAAEPEPVAAAPEAEAPPGRTPLIGSSEPEPV